MIVLRNKSLSLFVSPLAQNCSGLRTCSQCLEQPECGWCGDPSSTGKGLCIEGSYRGPMKRLAKQGQQVQSQDMILEPGICPKDKGYEWAFIHCPGKESTSSLSYWNYRSCVISVPSWEVVITVPINCHVLSLKKCSCQGFLLQLPYATNPSLLTLCNLMLVCHLMQSSSPSPYNHVI